MIRNTLIASIVFLLSTFAYPIDTVSSTAIKESCTATRCLSESSTLIESTNIYGYIVSRSISKRLHGLSKGAVVSSKPKAKKGDYDEAI